MRVPEPYLLFLGDATDPIAAKTARGIAQWRPEKCVGQLRLPGATVSVGLPDLSIEGAVVAGAKTLIIGIANHGGYVAEAWIPTMLQALEAGLDVANGLHARLATLPAVAECARRCGRTLHDVRHPSQSYPIGRGRRRSGRRLLTVGTDCSVGKMYASLAIEEEMRRRGIDADFRATGQTGILIAGEGVPVDAVVADFIAGAVEQLTPDADPGHWDIIEGQGSLFHPSYAGVSLGLLHGAAADALVLCHEPTRPHMRHLPDYPVPSLARCIEANLEAARLTNPDCHLLGIALNTERLEPGEAEAVCRSLEHEFSLPCVDPLRHGAGAIVDQLGL
jgi:uncharacterized NAD-dependent epimerase/dehydratase family protein